MIINISGYITSVSDKYIIIRIDKEEEDRINNAFSKAKKELTVSSLVKIKIQKTRFSIALIEWNNLNELIGIPVKCSCYVQKYKFISNDKLIEGYTFRCNTIHNII